ncbi:hypothetical protein, partial [Shigella flexneri]|uniref:hypothetical protein n=1 Tax=Shigella flexneri TaxID=623 RepID=UPI0019D45D38
ARLHTLTHCLKCHMPDNLGVMRRHISPGYIQVARVIDHNTQAFCIADFFNIPDEYPTALESMRS